MITPCHSRAIGQILTWDEEPLGTGSLISVEGNAGKVLTAGHVVDGHERVKICFDKAEGQMVISTEIVRGLHDWALLSIEAPAKVMPLMLYQPPCTIEAVRWWTIGYPRLVRRTRASFHGDVCVMDADEIDLHCAKLSAGAPSSDAGGLSGAPCLIDGGVAGILSTVMEIEEGGRKSNPTAAMFALPSKIIAAESGLTLANGAELPWELIFTGAVEHWPSSWRRSAASIAKLEKNVDYAPNIIARRMINEGIETIGLVLLGLRRPIHESRPIIELASTLWIDGQAAMHMDEAIDHDKPALLLAANPQMSAEHHLFRAFACRNDGHPTWIYVHVGSVERDLVEVIADVDSSLRGRFGDVSSDKVRRKIESGPPVTVFLHGSPREDLTKALKKEWAKLRIVYLINAVISSTSPPAVEVIAPVHNEDQEKDAMDALKRWYRELELLIGGAR